MLIQLSPSWLHQELNRRRVDLHHAAGIVEHHDAGRQRIQQRAQALGQGGLFKILLAQCAIGRFQFTRQAGHLALQFAVGPAQFLRGATEHAEGLGQPLGLFRRYLAGRPR
jgi:hypothetical protein